MMRLLLKLKIDYETFYDATAAEKYQTVLRQQTTANDPVWAPDLVETIMAGQQPEGLTVARVMQPIPWEWRRQSFA